MDIQGLKDSKWENIHDILANISERSKSDYEFSEEGDSRNQDMIWPDEIQGKNNSSYIEEELSDFAKSDIDL